MRVNQHGGFFHFPVNQHGQRLQTAGQGVFNGRAVLLRGLLQHPIDHFGFVTRVAHADAQAPVVGAAELGVNVAQTVVTGVAAAKFKFELARHDIELVMCHQNFFGLDLEKTGQCSNGFA